MADPSIPFTIAQHVKNIIVASYATQGLSLPARQYVSPGLPVFDCEQLAVQLVQIAAHGGSVSSTAPHSSIRGDVQLRMRYVQLAIYVVRCVPTQDANGDPPTVAAIESAAMVLYEDPLAIENAIFDATDTGLLPGCQAVSFERWDTVNPSGGLAAGVTLFRFDLSAGA